MGGSLALWSATISPRIVAGGQAQLQQGTLGAGPGVLAWPGLLRKLDRLDPSYRS
jgi:hypothetical protein